MDVVNESSPSFSRLERVRRAILFHRLDRRPVVFWNRDQTEGDVMLCHLALGVPGDGSVNAWGWSSPADIRAEAQRLFHHLATPDGGFIGYVEEYRVMGMPAQNYHACGEAFRRLDCHQPNNLLRSL
jgi:hypothetical protein